MRAAGRVTALVLIGCDDQPLIPRGREVAAALRDPVPRCGIPRPPSDVARARRDRRHHLPTLAHWAGPPPGRPRPRLGALRTPVLLAVGRDDPRRERAPRLAALFHDGHLVTVPGDADGVLASPDARVVRRRVREPPAAGA